MGDFATLEKKIEEKEYNGVDINPAAEALKAALSSFLNKEQTRQLIVQMLSEYSCNRSIQLIDPQGVQKEQLGDEPRHYLFPSILSTVNLNLPVALIGPAGSGKSTLCGQVAEALKLRFFLQNGVTGTHELTGYMDAHGRYQGSSFRDAFENGGLVLVDEVDTSDAAALKWLNTALANGYAAFPDVKEPVKRHPSFRIIIAANTWGTGADRIYVGSNQLDASTLDRFVFFDFGYDEKLEKLLAGNVAWTERVQKLRKDAEKAHARIVISPRASINGAKLIAAGWKTADVEQATIWKGIDPDLKDRIINPRVADNDNEKKRKAS